MPRKTRGCAATALKGSSEGPASQALAVTPRRPAGSTTAASDDRSGSACNTRGLELLVQRHQVLAGACCAWGTVRRNARCGG